MTEVHAAIDEVLDAVICDAFAGMTFADVERSRDGEFCWEAGDLYWAWIETLDPAVGEIAVLLPPELALEIAEATLGDEEDLGDAQLLEVLGELLNTIGGSWLARLADEGTPIRLGLPKTGRGSWSGEGQLLELAVYEIDEVCFGVALQRPAR